VNLLVRFSPAAALLVVVEHGLLRDGPGHRRALGCPQTWQSGAIQVD
jgi:hypothetical protein